MEKSVHELNQDELEELRGNYFTTTTNTDSDVLDDITSSDDIPVMLFYIMRVLHFIMMTFL
jgi:hypothetical protein